MIEAITCPVCDQDHGTGHWHLNLSPAEVIRVATVAALRREVEALTGRGLDHIGTFVEKAAVLSIIDPRRWRP